MRRPVVAVFSGAALLCTPLITSLAHAEQELIVSAGKGMDDTLIQRKSIAGAEMLGFSYAWRFSEFLGGAGRWQWWLQGSYSRMNIHYRGERQHQNIVEVKPVLRWYPGKEPFGLFGEAGVGAAYLSNQDFGNIHLTTKPNFALHFVAGYRMHSGHTISLRYSHFSNAYTNTPNPGFDFASLNGHFSF